MSYNRMLIDRPVPVDPSDSPYRTVGQAGAVYVWDDAAGAWQRVGVFAARSSHFRTDGGVGTGTDWGEVAFDDGRRFEASRRFHIGGVSYGSPTVAVEVRFDRPVEGPA